MLELIQSGIETLSGMSGEFLGLVFSLLGALIFYLFRLRPKLQVGLPHRSRHVLNTAAPDEPENQMEIYNEQFFVSNAGRKPALGVDVVLTHFPRNVAVNPPCDSSYKNVENGHCQISIPYIAAGELVTIDCIYLNQKAAVISSVRCSESVGKFVNFWTVRRFPTWANLLITLSMVLGVAFVFQFIVEVFR
jgi:hypothetical protein